MKSELRPGNVYTSAGSWTHSRRISVLVERPAGELFYRYTFVVTSFSKKIRAKILLTLIKDVAHGKLYQRGQKWIFHGQNK